MPFPVQEHQALMAGRAHMPVGPLQRLRVLPLFEQPPSRPHRLDSTTTSATGRLHDQEYGPAVTATEEGHTDGSEAHDGR